MNAFTPGGHIHEDQQIKPVRIAVLTISDTRDEESDTSGHVLAERILVRCRAAGCLASRVRRRRRDPCDARIRCRPYSGA